ASGDATTYDSHIVLHPCITSSNKVPRWASSPSVARDLSRPPSLELDLVSAFACSSRSLPTAYSRAWERPQWPRHLPQARLIASYGPYRSARFMPSGVRALLDAHETVRNRAAPQAHDRLALFVVFQRDGHAGERCVNHQVPVGTTLPVEHSPHLDTKLASVHHEPSVFQGENQITQSVIGVPPDERLKLRWIGFLDEQRLQLFNCVLHLGQHKLEPFFYFPLDAVHELQEAGTDPDRKGVGLFGVGEDDDTQSRFGHEGELRSKA